jgi:hypothetical protein
MACLRNAGALEKRHFDKQPPLPLSVSAAYLDRMTAEQMSLGKTSREWELVPQLRYEPPTHNSRCTRNLDAAFDALFEFIVAMSSDSAPDSTKGDIHVQ